VGNKIQVVFERTEDDLHKSCGEINNLQFDAREPSSAEQALRYAGVRFGNKSSLLKT